MVEVRQVPVGFKHSFQYLRDLLKSVKGGFRMDYRAALYYTKISPVCLTATILVF